MNPRQLANKEKFIPFAQTPFGKGTCPSTSPRSGARCVGDAGHTSPIHGADYGDEWEDERTNLG